MTRWRITETETGLRLDALRTRALGADRFTWAELLHTRLETVRTYVLYFPSRWDLPVDAAVTDALQAFGCNTPTATSVNFWDPTDPEFGQALKLFGLEAGPALVFVAGRQLAGMEQPGSGQASLYAIAITDAEMLGDRARLAPMANGMHQIVERGNPKEIARYLRERRLDAFLDTVGDLAAGLRDLLLQLKPKQLLPGGAALQLG
jgi:hypothetical protein